MYICVYILANCQMKRLKPEVTTAIMLEKRVTTKLEKHPVKLRITYEGKRKYYTIKAENYTVSEFEKIYNEKSRGENKITRKKFESIEDRAIDIIDNVLTKFSFGSFEKEYLNKKGKQITIQSYYEVKIKELLKEGKLQSAELYDLSLKSLEVFDPRLTFEKITPKFLMDYDEKMIEKDKSHATIGIYLRNLRHIINNAIEEGVPIDYPFGKKKYIIPKGNNKKKTLTIIEIEKLYNHETQNRNEYLALNYWLFSYLCNGINMVDIANLKFKNIQDKNLKFIRQKTKYTSKKAPLIQVLLLPKALEIISNIGNENVPDNYIFPIFESGQTNIQKRKILKQHIKQTNKYIRNIAKELGIDENITTYWARHSFATVLKRSGAPMEYISEQLGHQSLQVTSSYLDSFEDEQREKYSTKLTDFGNHN